MKNKGRYFTSLRSFNSVFQQRALGCFSLPPCPPLPLLQYAIIFPTHAFGMNSVVAGILAGCEDGREPGPCSDLPCSWEIR